MENKCAISQNEIFSYCHCTNCEENGPLLCYEQFFNKLCLLDLNKLKDDSSLMPKKEDFLSEVRNESKANCFILLQEAKASIIDDLHKAENSKNLRLSINIGSYNNTN